MDIKSALIVDDSKMARITLKRQLESRGIVISQAESGEEAIDILATNRPDIIFMDCLMPGIDGFEATRQIKTNSDFATIPIVMCTGKESDEDKQKAFDLGAMGYMTKSSNSEALNAILDDFSTMETQIPTIIHEPEMIAESSEPVSTEAAVIDTNEINRIAEQTASRIAEQISQEIATGIAEKISLAQINTVNAQNSLDFKKKITAITEQLDNKVLFSVKASLEQAHDYVDTKIDNINKVIIPDVKVNIIDSVTESIDNNKQLLLQEVENVKAQFKQLDINKIVEQQCQQQLRQPISTMLEKEASQNMLNKSIQQQLVELQTKLETLQQEADTKAGSNSNTLSLIALIMGAGALLISAYLVLQ